MVGNGACANLRSLASLKVRNVKWHRDWIECGTATSYRLLLFWKLPPLALPRLLVNYKQNIYLQRRKFWDHVFSPVLSSDTSTSQNLSPTRVTHQSRTTLKFDIHVRHLFHKSIDTTFRQHYPLTHQPTRATHQFHTILKGLDIDVRHLSHKTIGTIFRPHYPLTHQPHIIWQLWESCTLTSSADLPSLVSLNTLLCRCFCPTWGSSKQGRRGNRARDLHSYFGWGG